MILSQLALAALVAIRAAVVKGYLKCCPLSGGEVVNGGVQFSGSPSLGVGSNQSRVFLSPFLFRSACFLWMVLPTALGIISPYLLGRWLCPPPLSRGPAFVSIFNCPFSAASIAVIFIFFVLFAVYLPCLIRIIRAPSPSVSVVPLSVIFSPRCNHFLFACLARRLHATSTKIELLQREFRETTSANLGYGGHSKVIIT